jgi:hypothetical protein
MKICTTCQIEKEESEFRKNKTIKCGLDGACKPCKALEKKRWKEKNKEYYLAQQREYALKRYHENIDRERKRNAEWRKNNPEKYKESNKKSCSLSFQKNKDERIKKAREYRENNREKVREASRKYKAENYDKIMAKHKEYWARYPEKYKAQRAVNNAIAQGKMAKPSYCSRCLKECKPEGHHADYSKPLEVERVCRECHNMIHGKCKTALQEK